MDELLSRAYTQEQAEADKETQTDLLLEEGTYRTLPALTLTPRVSDRVQVLEGGTKRGRIEFRFFAQVEHEQTRAKGAVPFTISPDKVKNQNGRWDAASQKWTQAVTAFRVSHGREPRTLLEVAEYLRDYPVRLRVTRMAGNERFPDPSNFVQTISPVRD
jgi:hypothetical protein